MKKQPNSFRPKLEVLEQRCVPAGNVLVQQVGDTLYLLGDEGDNHIQLDGGTPALMVSSTDTLLNNLPSLPAYQNVRNVVIDLEKGNDWVTTNNFSLDGNLVIDMGLGDDFVNLLATTIQGSVILDMGSAAGNDHVLFQFVQIMNTSSADLALSILTGAGNDGVTFDAYTIVAGNARFDLGPGQDRVSFPGNTALGPFVVAGDLTIDGGPGPFDIWDSGIGWYVVGGVFTLIGFEY